MIRASDRGYPYLAERDLPDGRRAWVIDMIFNERIVVGDPHSETYDAYWCFNKGAGVLALAAWDGTGEPRGWKKNGQTGERAPSAS